MHVAMDGTFFFKYRYIIEGVDRITLFDDSVSGDVFTFILLSYIVMHNPT